MMNTSTRILKGIVSSVFITLTCFVASAQQQILDTLNKRFDRHRIQHLQEKLYLHIDRTSFITGETMWFSIYSVNGTTHQPLDLSRVAYVEIIDRNNQPVLQTKVELNSGSGDGSLFIPATILSDNYTLRCYTSWMKNVGPEFFFHQPISIINPFREPNVATTKRHATIDAQFLPEGGHLVDGIPSIIAFRVTDASGKGIHFQGYVLHASDTVAKFTPQQFGLGTFSFTPGAEKNYRIVVKHNNQSETFPFPKIHAEGYSLSLKQQESKIDIYATAKFQNLASPFLYLFVHSRNQIVVSQILYLNNGNGFFSVDKNELPDGISHITIFDHQLQPVCERLYFKVPKKELKIQIQNDAREYATRSKVKLSAVVNTNSEPAHLSISVFRNDSLQYFQQTDIRSYLFLNSDLHGTIESAETYFKPGSENMIDLLMLTHGWRRFSWENVLSGKNVNPEYLPETQGHLISGTVLDEAGAAAPHVQAYLSYPAKKVNVYSTTSNRQGKVYYITKNLNGLSRIILQTNLAIDSAHRIVIDNPFSDRFSKILIPEFKLSASSKKNLTTRSIAMQVQDIFYEHRGGTTSFVSDDTIAFYGRANETYYLDAFTRFPVMEEVMREYVPGVWVRKRKGGFYFMVLDSNNKKVFKEDPLVLIDGVPVFDIDRIMSFDPLKIKKLEVVTQLYYLGNMTFPGIVSYSTYTGDLAGFPLPPKAMVIDYEGLQSKREFYMPRYENDTQRQSRMPDHRHLLYWSPNVEIKNGIAEVEFYTSDLTGDFSVQIHGLSDGGSPGSAFTNFTVKELNH